VEGKAAQKKRRNDKADNKRAVTTANNTPTTKNGGRGKNAHQPRTNTPCARGPGQEVAYHIHETAHDLRAYAVTITVHWVPGHTDIPGNEAADRLAKQATAMPPTRQQPITLTWLRRRVREPHTADWEEWYDTSPQPKSYSAPHRKRMDSAYTALPRKLSTAILGLHTGHGYFLHCLAQPPSDNYPSWNCRCPLHPPQTPKHLLLSCPEFRTSHEVLRQDLKLHRNTRLNMNIILYNPPGIKALSTFLSATKVATAEWAHARLSMARRRGHSQTDDN
jgi:hypothetical protein